MQTLISKKNYYTPLAVNNRKCAYFYNPVIGFFQMCCKGLQSKKSGYSCFRIQKGFQFHDWKIKLKRVWENVFH